jgi:hypothetical protein
MDATLEDDLESREPEDAISSTRMRARVEYDDTREITECIQYALNADGGKGRAGEGQLAVPVEIVITTEDGWERSIETAIELDTTDRVGEPPAVPRIEELAPLRTFWMPPPRIFQGKLLDPERGLAVWPTACSGAQQKDPSEASGESGPSPAELVAKLNGPLRMVTGDEPELPAVTLTITSDDPTACHHSLRGFSVDLDLTVETAGVKASSTAKAGFTPSQGSDAPNHWDVHVTQFCLDVSGSDAWREEAPRGQQSAELCIAAEIRLSDRGASVIAELSITGTGILWVYQQQATTNP